MATKAQAESVIKNIIREIAQECASRGTGVSETLVAFMVKAVVLDPENNFNVDRVLTKDDVQKLIRICVERLLNPQSPSLETIQMQVYFDMNYTSRNEFLNEHRRVLDSRLQPVAREITDSRAKTREEMESVYRKIVSYVLLRSGLGSPTDISVVREATAALQSVFPHMELGTFMSMTKKDKERQLQELTMIVTGIRLFNKECGKGGEGIDDLPAILNEAVPATSHSVESELQEALAAAFRYTALIEESEQKRQEVRTPSASSRPKTQPTPKPELPIPLIKDALINVRQYEQFLRIVMNDIILCAQQVERLQLDLRARLDQLKATVQSKTAVPTAQVYPQFIHVCQLWTGFQDEMVLLSVLSNIFTSLQPYIKVQAQMFPSEILLAHLEDVHVKTDEERLSSEEMSGDEGRVDVKYWKAENHEWLFPETTKNFKRITIAYKGYCAWALAKRDRLLLPGNPRVGLLQHKKALYAFSSKEAAYEFVEDIEGNLNTIAEVAKRSPELIQLLEMHAQFASLTPYGREQSGKLIEKPVTKCDGSTQTDTHILESNIVKSYEWNEWELRRKAIRLANLRRKVTKSMQSNLSHYRRDNISQVYLPKPQGIQTKRDNYGNVPKPQTFIAGLRGVPGNKATRAVKVDLTVDVEEQLFLNHLDTEPNPKFINETIDETDDNDELTQE